MESHQAKRHLHGEVGELDGLHGFAHELDVVEHIALPCKHGVALKVEVCHQVGIGVDVMFATTSQLCLACHEEVKHRGLVGKLGKDRERLHRHSYRMEESLVSATIIHGGEE